jgi:hypothetical protein
MSVGYGFASGFRVPWGCVFASALLMPAESAIRPEHRFSPLSESATFHAGTNRDLSAFLVTPL